MQTTDVLVIGAGIVGAACAHALAQAGLSVRVIDARLGGGEFVEHVALHSTQSVGQSVGLHAWIEVRKDKLFFI